MGHYFKYQEKRVLFKELKYKTLFLPWLFQFVMAFQTGYAMSFAVKKNGKVKLVLWILIFTFIFSASVTCKYRSMSLVCQISSISQFVVPDSCLEGALRWARGTRRSQTQEGGKGEERTPPPPSVQHGVCPVGISQEDLQDVCRPSQVPGVCQMWTCLLRYSWYPVLQASRPMHCTLFYMLSSGSWAKGLLLLVLQPRQMGNPQVYCNPLAGCSRYLYLGWACSLGVLDSGWPPHPPVWYFPRDMRAATLDSGTLQCTHAQHQPSLTLVQVTAGDRV